MISVWLIIQYLSSIILYKVVHNFSIKLPYMYEDQLLALKATIQQINALELVPTAQPP